jgi:hypothetical protein
VTLNLQWGLLIALQITTLLTASVGMFMAIILVVGFQGRYVSIVTTLLMLGCTICL